jgi:hypothetical protein
LTVRGKLTLAFGGLAALVLLVAGLSMKSVADANERFVNYVHDKPMSFARSSNTCLSAAIAGSSATGPLLPTHHRDTP